jgi:hypothetical protein
MEDHKSIKDTLKKDGSDSKKGKIKIKKKESSSETPSKPSQTAGIKPRVNPPVGSSEVSTPKKDLSQLFQEEKKKQNFSSPPFPEPTKPRVIIKPSQAKSVPETPIETPIEEETVQEVPIAKDPVKNQELEQARFNRLLLQEGIEILLFPELLKSLRLLETILLIQAIVVLGVQVQVVVTKATIQDKAVRVDDLWVVVEINRLEVVQDLSKLVEI